MKLIYAITSQEPFFGNLNQSIEVHFFKSESHLSFWKRTTSTRISVPKPPKSQICHLKEREERGQGHNLWGKIDHHILLQCTNITSFSSPVMKFTTNSFDMKCILKGTTSPPSVLEHPFHSCMLHYVSSSCFMTLFHPNKSEKAEQPGKKTVWKSLLRSCFFFQSSVKNMVFNLHFFPIFSIIFTERKPRICRSRHMPNPLTLGLPYSPGISATSSAKPAIGSSVDKGAKAKSKGPC